MEKLPKGNENYKHVRTLEKIQVKTLAEVEKEYITSIYLKAGKNKTLAAKWLGIGRATMYRKMIEHGIDKKEAPLKAPQIVID
jgi:DNA-binding NtrC family response regulator